MRYYTAILYFICESLIAQNPKLLFGYSDRGRFVQLDTLKALRDYEIRVDTNSVEPGMELIDVFSNQFEVIKPWYDHQLFPAFFNTRDLCKYRDSAVIYLLYSNKNKSHIFLKTTIKILRHIPIVTYCYSTNSNDSLFDHMIFLSTDLSCHSSLSYSWDDFPKCDYQIQSYEYIAISNDRLYLKYGSDSKLTWDDEIINAPLNILINKIISARDCDTVEMPPINGLFCSNKDSCHGSRIHQKASHEVQFEYSKNSAKKIKATIPKTEDYLINGKLRCRKGSLSDSTYVVIFYGKNGSVREIRMQKDSMVLDNIYNEDNSIWIGYLKSDPLFENIRQGGWFPVSLGTYSPAKVVNDTDTKIMPWYIKTKGHHPEGVWCLKNKHSKTVQYVEFHLIKTINSVQQIRNPNNPNDPTDLVDIEVPTYIIKSKVFNK